MTAKMGQKVPRDQVHLVPWTEGYQAVLTQKNTVIFTTARLPEREDSFKWVGPIFPNTNVLFARPDSGITVESANDLKGYKIGVVTDDYAGQQLLDLGVNQSQLVQATTVSTLIDQLENGEIDLMAYSKASGRFFTYMETGNAFKYRIVYTLPTVEGYYAFNKDVPDATVQAFQQALDDLKAEKNASGLSTYEKILGQNVPVVGLSQLQYLTEEWAPYNYEENGTATGISVDILEAIWQDIGVNRTPADIRIVPLSEGFQEVQNGSSVLFSIVKTPQREPLYQWVGPFTQANFVVFAPMDRNITINSAADLNNYRIGVVTGSIENTLLTDQGVNASRIVNGATPEDLLRMLEEGRIDLWATGDLAGRHQMLQAAADPNAYEIVYTLGTDDLYYIFSKDIPKVLVDSFSQS
ncbi:MAG TPA: transporter substrate-binding domain-containing protein, partial [Methanomicrobiales archaeon]|nr:transporter substrate-binding domain-containing protein [Methanomicrobiales archaeon]